MTPGARLQAAVELLSIVEGGQQPADRALRDWGRRSRFAGSGDRAAVSNILYGVLRRRAQIDWWIKRAGAFVSARSRAIAYALLADGWRPDSLAAFFDGSAYHPYPLDAYEKTLLSALAGQALDHPEQPVPVRANYPDWMDASLTAAFGTERVAEMQAMAAEAPVDLQVNTMRTGREAALASLSRDGIEAMPTPLSPIGIRLQGRRPLAGTEAMKSGWVEPQDEASQIAALLVGARPDMEVVDYCAGGGGKTLVLAACMRNRGRLVACDIAQRRLERAVPRLEKAGFDIVTYRTLPAAPAVLPPQGFDRVLVDAPCTGTGALRRNPETRWRLYPESLAGLVRTQAALLEGAATLVKPGGRLVYATCSLLPEENEARIAAFLETALKTNRESAPFRLLPMPEVWAATVGGPCPAADPMLRLSPHRTGTDGFFVAVMERQP